MNVTDVGGGNAKLDWTTAAPGYQLESTNALPGAYAFLDVLERVGARVARRETSTVVQGTGKLVGVDLERVRQLALQSRAYLFQAQGLTLDVLAPGTCTRSSTTASCPAPAP